MDTAQIVLYQAVVMFLMIVVGYIYYRIHIISPPLTFSSLNLLLLVVNPASSSFLFRWDFDARLVSGLLISIGLSVLSIVLMMFFDPVVLKKKPEMQYKVDRFAAFIQTAASFATRLCPPCLARRGASVPPLIATSNFFIVDGVGVYTGKMNVRQLANCLKRPPSSPFCWGHPVFLSHPHPGFCLRPHSVHRQHEFASCYDCRRRSHRPDQRRQSVCQVAALLCEHRPPVHDPLLCIAVFALSLLEDTVAPHGASRGQQPLRPFPS